MLVIIEENYKISVWCREIVDGLRSEARKKRVSLTFSTSIDDIESSTEDYAVIIVGAETEWLNLAAKKAKAYSKHPIILSNQSDNIFDEKISRVTDDIFGSMGEIIRLFSQKGIENVALYAVNPDSASDSFKKEAFLKANDSVGDIFINEGSLDECFSHFYEKHRAKKYEGIVCSNDFAAISLIRHLKSVGEDLGKIDIISYSDTLISRCTSPTVSTVRANFKSFGQLAFMIVDCIGKSESISGMRILCTWEIIHRETSSPPSKKKIQNQIAPVKNSVDFYSDPSLMEMMRIETLLSQCDETDLDIIEAILDGKKTAEIELLCFLTETAVKYRIKKMKDICDCATREDLRVFLSSHIHGVSSLK